MHAGKGQGNILNAIIGLPVRIESRAECPLELRALTVGEWLSLVEHLVRDQGVGGSNPLSPTILSGT
jgi:hypothetical protein